MYVCIAPCTAAAVAVSNDPAAHFALLMIQIFVKLFFPQIERQAWCSMSVKTTRLREKLLLTSDVFSPRRRKLKETFSAASDEVGQRG